MKLPTANCQVDTATATGEWFWNERTNEDKCEGGRDLRYYETLYIVHPDYEEERLAHVKQSVDRWVSDRGGNIINSYVWGKRKLAYPVDRQRYGTYIFLNYGTEKPFIPELNEWFELHEAVLAYLTVQLDDEPASRGGEDKG